MNGLAPIHPALNRSISPTRNPQSQPQSAPPPAPLLSARLRFGLRLFGDRREGEASLPRPLPRLLLSPPLASALRGSVSRPWRPCHPSPIRSGLKISLLFSSNYNTMKGREQFFVVRKKLKFNSETEACLQKLYSVDCISLFPYITSSPEQFLVFLFSILV